MDYFILDIIMHTLNCLIDQCPFATPDIDMAGAVTILTIHGSVHQNALQQPVAHVARAPRLERPRIKMNATSEEWNAFHRGWETSPSLTHLLQLNFSNALLKNLVTLHFGRTLDLRHQLENKLHASSNHLLSSLLH